MCGSTRIRVAVILFLLISHLLLMRDDTIMAVPLRPAQDSEAVQILFLDGNKLELPVQGHATIKASVYDARGNLNNAHTSAQSIPSVQKLAKRYMSDDFQSRSKQSSPYPSQTSSKRRHDSDRHD